MKNIKNLLKRVSVVAVICLAYRLKTYTGADMCSDNSSM